MNGADLDALLEGYTDTQIEACLARRARAREAKRRAQTAARTIAYRDRVRANGDAGCDANSNVTVTQGVTQQNGSSQRSGDAGRDATVTRGVTVTATQTPIQSPMVSPGPPSFPASSPTHTHARPTVEEVERFLASSTLPVPIDKRPAMAQAYIDARERCDPPWTLPATNDKPARIINGNWHPDCRTFCNNWRDVLDREKALNDARIASFGGRGNGHDQPPRRRSAV